MTCCITVSIIKLYYTILYYRELFSAERYSQLAVIQTRLIILARWKIDGCDRKLTMFKGIV